MMRTSRGKNEEAGVDPGREGRQGLPVPDRHSWLTRPTQSGDGSRVGSIELFICQAKFDANCKCAFCSLHPPSLIMVSWIATTLIFAAAALANPINPLAGRSNLPGPSRTETNAQRFAR